MYVMNMRNELDYYFRIIKPIEKKYNRFCILYDIFKFNYFQKKKRYYNSILYMYYKMLIYDKKYTMQLEYEMRNIKDEKNDRNSII